MRLLDRMLALGFELYEGTPFRREDLEEDLRNAQFVVIDNVADYFYTQRANEFLTASDFPCVMLPFELCFMEFRFPKLGREVTGADEVGVLLTMEDPAKRKGVYPEVLGQPEVRYHLVGRYFVRALGSTKVILMADMVLPVGSDGRIITPASGKVHAATNLFTPVGDEEGRRNLQFIHQHVGFPVFFALSFMHCRNVRMKEEVPPPKLSKSHQRKRGRPLLRYHILEIDHMKSVLEREGKASSGGLEKALHICRGHFATYGVDGKGLLFGKHSGRYWIPMHTRGSAKEGVVAKDYEVK